MRSLVFLVLLSACWPTEPAPAPTGDCNGAALVEACDGIDTDCDGTTDELVDGDGDGFAACDGDCNDRRADVFLVADETCDAADNDCDGDVDEDFDGDGDGWLDEEPCLSAYGWPGDCDDADPTLHPGQWDECGDGVDADCDDEPETDQDGDGVLDCDEPD